MADETQTSPSRRSRGRRALRRLSLASVTVVLTLALLEGVVRLFPEPDGFTARVRAFSAAAVDRDPVLGHRLRPGAAVEVAGVAYRVSPLGTRGAAPLETGHRRLLLLGDSVTMGWGVAEEDTFAVRLADTLEPTQVVNAGVLAYGTRAEAAWLEEIGAAVHPDAVLVGYFPNDPESAESATRLPGPSWSRLWRILAPRLIALGVRLGVLPSAIEHHRQLHEAGTESWARAADGFRRMGRWCATQRVRCGVVLLPDLTVPPYEDAASYALAAVHAQVREVAEAKGFVVLDLAPLLAGSDLRALWVDPGDAHPNAAGHEAYAGAIADWLPASGLLPGEEPSPHPASP